MLDALFTCFHDTFLLSVPISFLRYMRFFLRTEFCLLIKPEVDFTGEMGK